MPAVERRDEVEKAQDALHRAEQAIAAAQRERDEADAALDRALSELRLGGGLLVASMRSCMSGGARGISSGATSSWRRSRLRGAAAHQPLGNQKSVSVARRAARRRRAQLSAPTRRGRGGGAEVSSRPCAPDETAGELLDDLGWLDAAQRRTFIDILRTRAGFRSIGDVEARERSEFASRSARVRLAATYGKPLRLAYREGGAIVDLDEVEADAAAERARAASLEAQRAARRADRDADAQALRAHEAARDAQHASELPAHLRPRTAA